MTLRAARRSSLVDQVIDQIKGEIAAGAWAVGGKIPAEPVLARAFGVGRNTVREAVRALTHAGLLECRQGDGTYVRATSELSGAVRRRLRTAEIVEILQVRRALDMEAARLAAVRRTDADILSIKQALIRREEVPASGDLGTFLDADLAFHAAIVEAAHNRVLAELYRDFNEALRAAVMATTDPLKQVDAPHAPIADSVAGGDPEGAERAMRVCADAVLRSLGEPHAR